MVSAPHEMPSAFAAAYNAGAMDRLLALYREDAVFLPDGVNALSGAPIADALRGFLALQGPMEMKLVRVVQAQD